MAPWIQTYIVPMAKSYALKPIAYALLALGAGSPLAKPAFQEMLFNPKWYRTFAATNSITPAEGTLLYAWDFSDPENRPDSFYVGIDTLWGLPQDQGGDTASDWDLQVCPDEICMNGLKAGIHGANSPYPFTGTKTRAEHHVQFFPAIDKNFDFTAPDRSVFGAMMFCRSRSTGTSDTVFAFGAWNLKWDPSALPPARPVGGYLPRLTDFAITGDTVRYLKAGAGIHPSRRKSAGPAQMKVVPDGQGLRIVLPNVGRERRVEILDAGGRRLWQSGRIPAGESGIVWKGGGALGPAIGIVRASWMGGSAQALVVFSAR